MESPTSPYTFRDASLQENINFIEEQKREKYIMFIRKVSMEFSDDILSHYIWREKKKDNYYIYYILFGFLLYLYHKIVK
jgi:wobble nucleotide-excising tRNase